MVPLSQDTSYVYSINVQGNDVYIAGMIVKKYSFLAAYWRNGIINYLKDGEYAYAAFIDGKDVYIAGIDQSYNPSAVYWKNGVPTRLPTPIPFAYTIFVKHHQ